MAMAGGGRIGGETLGFEVDYWMIVGESAMTDRGALWGLKERSKAEGGERDKTVEARGRSLPDKVDVWWSEPDREWKEDRCRESL